MGKLKKLKLILYTVVSILIIIVVIAGIYFIGERGDSSKAGTVLVTIPQGTSAWGVAKILKSIDMIKDKRRFVYHLKAKNMTNKLRAGTYELPYSASMASIVSILAKGREAMVNVTIPEGWNVREIASLLQEKRVCDSISFIQAVNDKNLIGEINLGKKSLEGYLFPDTYSFNYSQNAGEIVKIMTSGFRDRVGIEWLKSAKQNQLGIHGLVTLASIVQGEFQIAEEAPDIAALYLNRLSINMKLQADPTIQYILPDAPRHVLFRDLKIDSPYNTYKYKGLPPGPIGNPGLTALKAVLDPPDKPWLFMVARGDGGHAFTTNGKDHYREKAKFDKVRERVAREKRQHSGGQ